MENQKQTNQKKVYSGSILEGIRDYKQTDLRDREAYGMPPIKEQNAYMYKNIIGAFNEWKEKRAFTNYPFGYHFLCTQLQLWGLVEFTEQNIISLKEEIDIRISTSKVNFMKSIMEADRVGGLRKCRAEEIVLERYFDWIIAEEIDFQALLREAIKKDNDKSKYIS